MTCDFKFVSRENRRFATLQILDFADSSVRPNRRRFVCPERGIFAEGRETLDPQISRLVHLWICIILLMLHRKVGALRKFYDGHVRILQPQCFLV